MTEINLDELIKRLEDERDKLSENSMLGAACNTFITWLVEWYGDKTITK